MTREPLRTLCAGVFDVLCSQTLSGDLFSQNVWLDLLPSSAVLQVTDPAYMPVHFQTLPNAFEVFGLDFMVDASGEVWLLEVNAFPDFKQTGGDLKAIVGGFWEGVVRFAVAPFFGVEEVLQGKGEEEGMTLVKDIDLGRW